MSIGYQNVVFSSVKPYFIIQWLFSHGAKKEGIRGYQRMPFLFVNDETQ